MATQTTTTSADAFYKQVGRMYGTYTGDLNNINCGLLGMPLGFLVIIVVSLMGKEPSREMQALIDEIRKPRGRTVLEEKT